ncbi:MAG: asparaginase [Clostridiales bacterium]|nr:asparaginase [Clostridiales bacterium]MBQ2768933.1 asparaginase [Clostridia bacterium]
MKKILLIATGGTIASHSGEEGLIPEIQASGLLKCVPEVFDFCQPSAIQIFNIDSTNVTPAHWILLAQTIRENYDKYDGFVVCHGTDTMSYTAAMISYMVQHSPKPIVFTGSQQPIDKEDTDGRINLRDSFLYAASDNACDVVIVFQGKVIAGTKAKKVRTKSFNAFTSVSFPNLGVIRDGKVIQYIVTPKQENAEFFLELNDKVGLLMLTPGAKKEILDAYFRHLDAVVLSGYGTGGIPEGEYYGFYETIESWERKGKTLVVTTQVQEEGSDMNVYRVGRGLKNRFDLLESYSMTYESIITKLMWILAQTKDDEKIKELFYKTVNYDLIG